MRRFLLRWAIHAVALYVAVGTNFIPGIEAQDTRWWAIVGLALIFTLVNALLRPILKLITCPFILLTLGLFTLVINAVLFWLTGWIGQGFDIGFRATPAGAFWGGLVVGVVSALLTMALRRELNGRRS
jgi:putative membrane protein